MNKLPGWVRLWSTFLFCWLVWPQVAVEILWRAASTKAFSLSDVEPARFCCGFVGFVMGCTIGRVLAVNEVANPQEYRRRVLIAFKWSVPFTFFVLLAACMQMSDSPWRERGGPLFVICYATLVHLPVLWWFGWTSARLTPRHKVTP